MGKFLWCAVTRLCIFFLNHQFCTFHSRTTWLLIASCNVTTEIKQLKVTNCLKKGVTNICELQKKQELMESFKHASSHKNKSLKQIILITSLYYIESVHIIFVVYFLTHQSYFNSKILRFYTLLLLLIDQTGIFHIPHSTKACWTLDPYVLLEQS